MLIKSFLSTVVIYDKQKWWLAKYKLAREAQSWWAKHEKGCQKLIINPEFPV